MRKKREVIYFDDGDVAQEVLYDMKDILKEKGVITLKDYYDLINYYPENNELEKYGWRDLSEAKVSYKIFKFYNNKPLSKYHSELKLIREPFYYISLPRIRKLVREKKQ